MGDILMRGIIIANFFPIWYYLKNLKYSAVFQKCYYYVHEHIY